MTNSSKAYVPLIIIGILAATFIAAADSVLVFKLQPPMGNASSSRAQTVNILLYEGERIDGRFGFGKTPTNITSPGPTLRFTTADIVNITVVNVGKLPHAFAITTTPTTGASVLFSSEIASANDPLQPGQNGSVVFAPDNAGFSYWYISPVSGDSEAGMYGTVAISTISAS
jgi:FtsP/CotA-like multicopper oxidase with cupredoxin domain